MRLSILLTLLAASLVCAQPLGPIGAQLGMNQPFAAQNIGMGMGGMMGNVGMMTQPMMQQQPIAQFQPQLQQLQQPILAAANIPQQPINLQQPTQPLIGNVGMQQPLGWSGVGAAPITTPLANVGVPLTAVSAFTPLTSIPVGQAITQGGIQVQPVQGTINPVLPQDFGRPNVAPLVQPVLSQSQAENLIPMQQLQQQLNQRVASFGPVTPVQNLGVGVPVQQPIGVAQPVQQPFTNIGVQQPLGIGVQQPLALGVGQPNIAPQFGQQQPFINPQFNAPRF